MFGWLKILSLVLTLAHALWKWAERRRLLEQAKKETVDVLVKKVDELRSRAESASSSVKHDEPSILLDADNRLKEGSGGSSTPPSV